MEYTSNQRAAIFLVARFTRRLKNGKPIGTYLGFPSTRGPLTIEDLFDLPLTKNNGLNLDAVAIEINNQLQEKQGSTSFVESTVEKTAEITKLETMLEIVKLIIKQRQDENKNKLHAAALESRRKELQFLIDQKQRENLASLPLEELQQQLAELK